MSYHTGDFTFDFAASRIRVDAGVTVVDVELLYSAIKEAQATQEGVLYDPIARGSGLVDLGGGAAVAITVALLGSWQLEFPAGAYVATIQGGNLVGGLGGDPVAYSAGVQVLIVRAASATVVSMGSIASDIAQVKRVVEADEVYDQAAGLLHTYERGTTVNVIPPKTVTGTSQAADSGLVEAP